MLARGTARHGHPFRLMGWVGFAIAVAWIVQDRPAMADWFTYENARFNFSFRYPSPPFFAGPAPVNGDGRSFFTQDGRAEISVWGAHNVTGETPRSALAAFREDLAPDESLTYARHGKRWLVVSGYTGNNIYYQRTEYACRGRKQVSFRIEYPIVERDRYDPLIATLAKGLKVRCP